MKKLIMILLLLLLAACQPQSDSDDDSKIDWPDFVQLDGTKYEASPTTVITAEDSIGEQAGTVDFTISQEVSDANYQAEDKDATYLEEGTKLYHIPDEPNLLAAPDAKAVNGYKIYLAESAELEQRYENLDTDSVNKVDIFEGRDEPAQLNKLSSERQIDTLFDLLDDGEQDPDFSPDTSDKDSTVYHVVFYTEDSSVAHRYRLYYDEETWYWNQKGTQVIPDEIREVILAP